MHPFLYVVVYGVIWESHMKSGIRTANAWVLKLRFHIIFHIYQMVTRKLQILSSNTFYLFVVWVANTGRMTKFSQFNKVILMGNGDFPVSAITDKIILTSRNR